MRRKNTVTFYKDQMLKHRLDQTLRAYETYHKKKKKMYRVHWLYSTHSSAKLYHISQYIKSIATTSEEARK